MNIQSFYKFLQELNESGTVELPILDVVIDDVGNVYNGINTELIKGRVERQLNKKITKILGTDNNTYPAGIDKNGNVVSILSDQEGRALNSKGEVIQVPSYIKRIVGHKYYYTSPEYDYYELIPISPTGWVNVKIDMEIVKRVKRFSRSLGTNSKGHQSFIDKISEFELFSSLKREEKYIKRLRRGTIQKEMSCILLLHYINEIKDFFNPSQGGFLFESFIAGLIPDSRIKEDNSPVDIKTTMGERYQLKFLDWKSEYVDITLDIERRDKNGKVIYSPSGDIYLDHYMIAVKYIDKVELLVIDGLELKKRIENNTIGDLITKGIKKDKGKNLPAEPKFKISKFLSSNDEKLVRKFKIELSDIDGRIKNLGDNLKNNLDDLYSELSKFQYNVETIITGIDEKGKPVRSIEEFSRYDNEAQLNIDALKVHLKNLVADIKKDGK